MSFDREHFRAWLLEQDYRPATARKYASDLASYLRDPEIGRSTRPARARDYLIAYRLYQTYAGETGAAHLRAPIPPGASKEDVRRAKRRQKTAPKRGFPPAEWKRLRQAIDEDPSPAGYVLAVMAATGLRIADVLRIDYEQLDEAFATHGTFTIEVKGGRELAYSVQTAPEAWRDLYEQMQPGENVAAYASPSGSPSAAAGGSAYFAVKRAFERLAEEARVTPPIHLHRIRRTVSNELIAAGATLEEVQHVLGHASRATTETYLQDDQTNLAVGALQRLRANEGK